MTRRGSFRVIEKNEKARPDAPRTYRLLSAGEAASAADTLIQESSPFALEPLPDDEWTLTAKATVQATLETRLGRELFQERT